MRSQVIFDTYLDTRYQNRFGLYPVKLRVTFQRRTTYFKTEVYLDEHDYKKVIGKNPKGKFQEIKFTLDGVLDKAKTLKSELGTFSLKEFENQFYKSNPGKQDVFSVYHEIIDNFNSLESYSTAEIYQNSLKMVTEFFGKERSILPFENIKESDLEKFLSHYKAKEKSMTTISIYLRCLRRVYSKAIKEKYCLPEYDPFKSEFKIPKSQNIKKALVKEDIDKIIKYNAVRGSQKEKSRDFWLLSFYCNGINMGDLLRIKNCDINGNTLTFIRKKTEKSSDNDIKPILVKLTTMSQEIINRYRNPSKSSNDFLFSYLAGNYSEKQIRTRIKSFIRMVNRHMKMIAQELGIDPKISTYYARHSFATLAYNKELPLSYISESLGHSSFNTTQNYIKSLDSEVISKHTDKVFEDFF